MGPDSTRVPGALLNYIVMQRNVKTALSLSKMALSLRDDACPPSHPDVPGFTPRCARIHTPMCPPSHPDVPAFTPRCSESRAQGSSATSGSSGVAAATAIASSLGSAATECRTVRTAPTRKAAPMTVGARQRRELPFFALFDD